MRLLLKQFFFKFDYPVIVLLLAITLQLISILQNVNY